MMSRRLFGKLFPVFQLNNIFSCNIKQPGCENVCFNDFSPISHVRFWGFQIIAVALPSILFIVYAAHEVGRKVSRPSGNHKLGTIKGPIGRIGSRLKTAQSKRNSRLICHTNSVSKLVQANKKFQHFWRKTEKHQRVLQKISKVLVRKKASKKDSCSKKEVSSFRRRARNGDQADRT